MAYPNRRDPANRELEDNLRRGGAGAAWVTWWWVWLFIIIVCAFWFWGWGWGGYGGYWWGARARTVAVNGNNANPTGQGVSVLSASNKRPFVGQQFQVNGVRVESKVNDNTFWIGTSAKSPMQVTIQNGSHANVSPGDLVNVTGRVEIAPDMATAQKQLKLNQTQTDLLEQQGAYIQGSQFQEANPRSAKR